VFMILLSAETTLLCTNNSPEYDEGSTVAGDYCFDFSTGINRVGLGYSVFYNAFGAGPNDNAESVAIGNRAGLALYGQGYAIAGHDVYESEHWGRTNTLYIGNSIELLDSREDATAIGNYVDINCSDCVVLGKQKLFTVDDDGDQDVGIGITDPKGGLHVYGNGSDANPHVRLEKTNTNDIKLFYRHASGNFMNWYNAETNDVNSSANFKLATTFNGSMMTLYGNGDATLTSLLQLSDATLKTNISPLQHSLYKISKIKPIKYTWVDPSKGQKKHLGFSAQNVHAHFPSLTDKNDDDYFTVNYFHMNAVLWEALKEIHVASKTQHEKIAEQEKKIALLKQRMQQHSNNKTVASHEK
jgi:hypothetical protein